ncbi:MAG: hypothetical protein C4346_16185 [Chloroflexota bacterium]
MAKTTPISHPSVTFAASAVDDTWHRRVHPGVFQALVSSLQPGARVLDVGCGTGIMQSRSIIAAMSSS